MTFNLAGMATDLILSGKYLSLAVVAFVKVAFSVYVRCRYNIQASAQSQTCDTE